MIFYTPEQVKAICFTKHFLFSKVTMDAVYSKRPMQGANGNFMVVRMMMVLVADIMGHLLEHASFVWQLTL